MKSKTRSRGASIELFREIGPTGGRFYCQAPRPPESREEGWKTWTFRTTVGQFLANTQYPQYHRMTPDDCAWTESGQRPPCWRAGRWGRFLHLSGVLLSGLLRAGRDDSQVSQLRGDRLSPILDVRTAHAEDHRGHPALREARRVARRGAGVDRRPRQVPGDVRRRPDDRGRALRRVVANRPEPLGGHPARRPHGLAPARGDRANARG